MSTIKLIDQRQSLITDQYLTEEQRIIKAQSEQQLEKKEQIEEVKKSWFLRTFGKMEKGSLRISVFTLIASALGTGLFGLPYIASQTGLIMVVIFILIGCVFSLTSMYLLMSVALPKGVKSYNQLAALAYGNWLKRLSEICIILYSWGITICFQVIFARFVVQVADEIFDIQVYQNKQIRQLNSLGNKIRLYANATNIIINMIFILQKSLYSLRFITIAGTLFVFYNTILIIFYSFHGFNDPQQGYFPSILHRTKQQWSQLKLFNFDKPLQQMAGMASTIFCFVNHQLIFPLAHELRRPSQKRLRTIFNRAHIFESCVYLLVTIFGYLLLFETNIQPIIIQSIPTTPMIVGKCFMMVMVFFSVPLNTLPARQMFFNSLNLNKNSNKLHILVSCGFAFVGCIIAMVFVKVNSYFGLLGGTCGTLMAGSIPAMVWLKLTNKSLKSRQCIAIICFYSIMTVVGFVGAVGSIIH